MAKMNAALQKHAAVVTGSFLLAVLYGVQHWIKYAHQVPDIDIFCTSSWEDAQTCGEEVLLDLGYTKEETTRWGRQLREYQDVCEKPNKATAKQMVPLLQEVRDEAARQNPQHPPNRRGPCSREKNGKASGSTNPVL